MQRIACFWGKFACFCVPFVVFAPSHAQSETLTVFAASSLHDALGEIALRYEGETGTDITLVFAATSSVARQVARGAPADAVLMADMDWADWLVEQGAVTDVTAFASNRLVVIGRDVAPLSGPAQIEAALGDSVLAMAQVDAVPAGRYGRAALMSLGVWDALESRVVQAANVRAALRFVQRGEAPLAIGYASDLVALPMLTQVFSFAPDTHPEIIYSGGSITEQGVEFMTYLQGETAQAILGDWGFSPVAP